MMQVFQLIKKDILLAGVYFLFSIVMIVVMPVFLSNQGSAQFSSIYILFMSLSFSCYFLFNNIFLMEDKYKGNLYLMVVPYKKWTIAIAKYIMGMLMFVMEVTCYFFLSTVSVNYITLVKPKLTFDSVSIVFFAISVVLSIFFPLYFRYSYTKIKAALIIVMILLPTWGLVGLTSLLGKNFVTGTPTIGISGSLIFILLGTIVILLSAWISNRFLEKRSF